MDSKAIIRILPNQNQSFYISGKGFRLPAFLREEIPKKRMFFPFRRRLIIGTAIRQTAERHAHPGAFDCKAPSRLPGAHGG
ncbi:MAG: hypothetical protein ACLUE8_03070 [Lachnospiraceae bacterium]